MSIFQTLWMTKAKLLLLIVFLLASVSKYYNSNCATGVCPTDASAIACQCGFSLPNFFTIFVLAYVCACVIMEIYTFLIKSSKKVN